MAWFLTTRTAALLLAVLLLPSAALAADGERTPLDLGGPGAAGGTPEVGGTGGGLVRTIVGLAIVLGVIYGLHWILKQVKASKEAGTAGHGLKPLATVGLGPKGTLHLVRAGDEVVLLGVGEGGVTPIRVYSDAEARAAGLIGPDADGPGGTRLPGLMDAGPVTVPKRVGRALRGGGVARMVEDLRSRTVIR